MGIKYAYTRNEAVEQLAIWKECFRSIAEGEAAHYRIGSREYTALNLDEVRKNIEFFADIIESYDGNVRTRRVAVVVPRDL
jgi:hypothetical protein